MPPNSATPGPHSRFRAVLVHASEHQDSRLSSRPITSFLQALRWPFQGLAMIMSAWVACQLAIFDSDVTDIFKREKISPELKLAL